MWKWLLWVAAGVCVLVLTAGVLVGIKWLRPDLLKPDLKKEFTVTGLAVGAATHEEVVARFGPPTRTHNEHMSTVYEYPDLGVLLRLDDRTGTLVWYEITSERFATGKGMRVGDPLTLVLASYGDPTTSARLTAGTRVRYHYGTAYVLEFWVDKQERISRVVFFRA